MIVGSQERHTFCRHRMVRLVRLGRTCGFCEVCLMKKVLNIFSFVGSEKRFGEHL